MSQPSSLRVDVVATTRFTPPADIPWSTDAEGGQALAEFAGRACYRSWDKPNPATATNAGYVQHIMEVGHLTVLEHAQVSVYIRGVSRSVTHEFIRHRHFSYSQLSQRHVIDDPAYMFPDLVSDDPELAGLFEQAAEQVTKAHRQLDQAIAQRMGGRSDAVRSKRLRQAAQTLLPGARATEIVVTGNLRAWRQLIAAHGSEHAHDELREVVIACLEKVREIEPNAFADFVISELPDGRRIASSALVAEG